MSNIPDRGGPILGNVLESVDFAADAGPLRRVSWAAVSRNRWLVLGCLVVVVAATVALTRLAVPVYEGSTTLRIEEKERNLPEVFRLAPSERRIGAEVEELRSRSIAAGVVRELSLRLTLSEPRATRRSDLLQAIQVTDSAESGEYTLVQQPGVGFVLLDASGTSQGEFRAGERIEFGGIGFALTPAAVQLPRIRFEIESFGLVTARVVREVSVTQPSREVNFVKVSYRSEDRELSWRVPDAIAKSYIALRQDLKALETRGTVAFLRQQIDTISGQLAQSERQLELYREQYDVIHPQAEASGQVGRLMAMQSQRGVLDNERGALASLLTEVDSIAARHTAGDPSPYRRLLAFPSLLQSQAATGLLQSLTVIEDQRKALLTRRKTEDSDVKALDGRVGELERELRSIAATYLQGISNQVQLLDRSLDEFRVELRAIPEKELQYARLERQPKVLEGVYTLLQTRLKEAEVAAAAGDPGVRIVDAAIPPMRPVWPKPVVNAVAAIVCGLLLGVAAALARDYMDGVIRSRMDIRGSTGLPVLGVIPRIQRKKSPVALIAEPKKRLVEPVPPPTAPSPPAPPTERNYTFLRSAPIEEPIETLQRLQVKQQPPTVRVSLSIPTTAGVEAEAYGALQTNIAFSRRDTPVKTLVFTSPLSGDGKTTTVVNLAISLVQRGIRVLLIDADVRRGVVHSVFGGHREPGLAEILKGREQFDTARRTASVGERGSLDYLTTGKISHENYGLVSSDAMRDLLARVRDEYDVVIIDTAPVNIITDAAVLGASADGVVLVVRAGVTEATALSYAVEQLRHVRAVVLGVVLNDIRPQRDAAYDSSYKYLQQSYEYSVNGR